MRFLVVPNWFCCTEAENDDIRIFSALVGSPPRSLSAINVCLRNVHHLYHLLDCLFAVALEIPLKESRLPLAMISRRKYSWTDV